MADTVRIDGLKQVVRSLERYGVETSDLRSTFRRVGGLLARTASNLVDSRSGALAGDIRAGTAKNRAVARAGSASVLYAGVQNYGGYNNITPQAFMQRALEAEGPAALRQLTTDLNTLARRVGLK